MADASDVRAPSDPRGLGLFRALRRIEASRPELPRIGCADTPAEEALRLGQDPSLAFESASIVSWHAGPQTIRIGVQPFGVFGPNGPLPLHVSELACQRRQQHGDAGLASFADIFHHRLLCYFYRAWAEAQPVVSCDRPEADSFARQLGALIGEHSTADEHGRLQLQAAGHLSAHTRHPEGLAKLLAAVCGCPVQIEEFVGTWLPIPDEFRWRIDPAAALDARPLGVLGQTSCVGSEVWDPASKFRVVMGPLQPEDQQRFQPGQPALARLVALVQRYAGPELAWELRLVGSRLTPTILGKQGTLGRSAHVGAESSAQWQDLQFDPLAEAGG
jgi:type VI secretion system protein ImpH